MSALKFRPKFKKVIRQYKQISKFTSNWSHNSRYNNKFGKAILLTIDFCTICKVEQEEIKRLQERSVRTQEEIISLEKQYSELDNDLRLNLENKRFLNNQLQVSSLIPLWKR